MENEEMSKTIAIVCTLDTHLNPEFARAAVEALEEMMKSR